MHEIKTEIAINTDVKKVWEILSDFASYPSWNSFFKHISGKLATDEILSITVASPFIHGEKFSGLLSSVFKWIGALDKTKKGFKLFNGDLKRLSEANH